VSISGIGMLYTILDTPPWYECALLGFQVRKGFSCANGQTRIYDR
jgi:hypothetical protein